MMGRKRDIFIAALILLGLWELLARLLQSMALPEPWQVLVDMCRKLSAGRLLADLAISLARALAGIGLALITAVPLGLVIGAERGLRRRSCYFSGLPAQDPHCLAGLDRYGGGNSFFR